VIHTTSGEISMNDMQQKVWRTIQEANRCWTCGDLSELDRLKEYFHREMVAITPTDKERREGRESCIEGWSNFAKSTKITSWEEIDPKIQLYGAAAVATYYFSLSFEINGQVINMHGRDMFTLINENDRWWIVADQFSATPNNREETT